MKSTTLILLATLCGALPAAGTLAAEAPSSPDKADSGAKAAKPLPEPQSFVTHHRGNFSGQVVNYTATASDLFISNDDGEPVARFFSIAYTRDGVSNPGRRPVTFIFNGGPGSASMWLHMGVFGPKRVQISSDPVDDGAPPYPVVDNRRTILDISDMVFIDPVTTGYSTVIGKGERKQFLGVTEDARSIANFIHAWIERNKRWNAPKYIAGESYGTLRTGAVMKELNSSRHNIAINGIILISAVLHYQNSRFAEGNIMSHVSFLPSYAATAWYHGKLPDRPADLEVFLDEARDFARHDYATALIAGTRLDPERRAGIIRRLHHFTGLTEDYLDKSNMRINVRRIFKQLRRDDKLVVGRLDSRFVGVERDAVGEFFESDPMSDSIGQAFVAAMHEYMSGDLGIEMDRPYHPSSLYAFKEWNWAVGPEGKVGNGGGYINVVPDLGRALRHNKDLRILVAAGYFDFATPFFGAENALAEIDVPPERIQFAYYRSGHMMYLHEPSRKKFIRDVRQFMSGTRK